MRSLLRMQHRILGGTRRLFRAAITAELRRPIWVVTRGAQRVTDADTVSPDQSCLWGFGRAASLELPHVWGGLADLAEGTADEWSRFINQVATRATRPSGRPNRAARSSGLRSPAGSTGWAAERYTTGTARRRNVFGDRRAGVDRAGDRRIPGRARRQASGADQPTRAQRCRATAHRRAERTARLRIPGRRCRCRRCARRRTPVGHRAGRATAVGRHRPRRGRDRHHPAEHPGRRRSRSRLRREGLGCLAFERSSR